MPDGMDERFVSGAYLYNRYLASGRENSRFQRQFDGSGSDRPQDNNLLDALLAATREEVDTHDIPEIQ